MLAMNAKTQKNIYFYDGQMFRRLCVNMIDSTRGCIVFFNERKFRTRISDVCKDLLELNREMDCSQYES